MKRIVKLTENHLSRIVKRVLNESDLQGNKSLLKENAKTLNRSSLEQTYRKYDDLGSTGTFDEIFKSKRSQFPYNQMLNGCATKVSLALKSAGQDLGSADYNLKWKVTDGPMKNTVVNVNAGNLVKQLTQLWGAPDVKINSVKSLEEVQNAIGPGRSGVFICAPCGFGSSCSGHATLWSWWKNNGKGGTLDNSGYEIGQTISFWQVGGNNEETAKKCGFNTWEEYEKSGFKCKTS